MIKSPSRAWTLALLLSTPLSVIAGDIPEIISQGNQTNSSQRQTRSTTKRSATSHPEQTPPKKQRTERPVQTEQTVAAPVSPQGGENTVELLENSWNLLINKNPIEPREMLTLYKRACENKNDGAREEFIARCNHNFINKSYREQRTENWFNLIDTSDVTKLNYDEFLFLFDLLSYKKTLLTNEKLLEILVHLMEKEKSAAEGSLEQAKFQVLLATCFQFGLGTTQNHQKALSSYTSAANLGLKRAQVYLWWFFNVTNNHTASEQYKQLACASDPADAICLYGVIEAQFTSLQLAFQAPTPRIDLTAPAKTAQATGTHPQTTTISPPPPTIPVFQAPIQPAYQNHAPLGFYNQQIMSPQQAQLIQQQAQQQMPQLQQVNHPMPVTQPAHNLQPPQNVLQTPTTTVTQQEIAAEDRSNLIAKKKEELRNMEFPELMKVINGQLNAMNFLQKTLIEKANAHQDTSKQLQEKNAALVEELKKVTDLLEAEKEKSQKLHNELEQTDLLCTLVSKENDSYKTERDSYKTNIDTLNDLLKKEESKSEKLQKQHDQEVVLVEQLSKKASEQNTQIVNARQVERKYKDLLESTKQIEKKHKDLQEKYSEKDKQNTKLTQELSKEKESNASLRKESKKKEDRLKKLTTVEKKVSDQATLIESLREELKTKSEKLETIEKLFKK